MLQLKEYDIFHFKYLASQITAASVGLPKISLSINRSIVPVTTDE